MDGLRRLPQGIARELLEQRREAVKSLGVVTSLSLTHTLSLSLSLPPYVWVCVCVSGGVESAGAAGAGEPGGALARSGRLSLTLSHTLAHPLFHSLGRCVRSEW